MISALRRLLCFLPVFVMASACQPADDGDEATTPPMADAGASESAGPTSLTKVEPTPEPEPGPIPVATPEPTPTPEPDPVPVAAPEPTPTPEPVVEAAALDLNDVSILLPPPSSSNDPVLAITDLTFAGASVWSDNVFAQFLEIVGGDDGAVAAADVANNQGGASIDIGAFGNKSAWHVASIRVDPGSPGLSSDIAEQFGQTPQIRLVLQPVTNGRVHDVAAHLIYSFIGGFEPPLPGCSIPRLKPDQDGFRQVVDDLVALKTMLATGRIGDEVIDTSGLLGIHPSAATTASVATRSAFRDALKGFLETHLDPSKLRAMAIMGLPGLNIPEPWIFVAMAPDQATGGFKALRSPALAQDDGERFAQMLDARQGTSVSPAVRANNLNPITCRFEVAPNNPAGATSPKNPNGVSTAELFPDASAERMREIVDVIADPEQAHFFNTDCVSCHTETRREMDILGTNQVDAPVDPDVLPAELWNVRNFGWFPSFFRGTVLATATRRTAAADGGSRRSDQCRSQGTLMHNRRCPPAPSSSRQS